MVQWNRIGVLQKVRQAAHYGFGFVVIIILSKVVCVEDTMRCVCQIQDRLISFFLSLAYRCLRGS